MKSIRICNDIKISWGLFVGNGLNRNPFDLSDKTVELYLVNPIMEKSQVKDFTIDKNIISWVFRGAEQEKTGQYSTMVVVKDKFGAMHTFDEYNVFRLVSTSNRTCDCGDNDNMTVVSLEVSSTIGMSLPVVLNEESVDFKNLTISLRKAVSVIDNLSTESSESPLSAKQGVVLKQLIDLLDKDVKATDEKISNAVKQIISDAPETLDTLKEIADWIETHGGEFTEVIKSVEDNKTKIENIKRKLDAELDVKAISSPAELDFNDYTDEGIYNIHCLSDAINSPILSSGEIKGRLTVLSVSLENNVVTQVVNLNNADGGEGNIYIRSWQNGTWKPWGKLQTNVEVGLIDQSQMDTLVDNGIYSGILSTTGETFVIICINNYAIAQQVGIQHISHLKYSLVVGTGEIKIEKRTRDAYGFWTEWENIGSGSILPKATADTLGGVMLGSVQNNNYAPLVEIGSDGSGVGIKIDSSCLRPNLLGQLSIPRNNTLSLDDCLGVKLGTATEYNDVIPCVLGTNITGRKVTGMDYIAVGIPYNIEQFSLKANGLNLKDGIGAGVTKVTWDASSNMNDFKTPGVYDIYGERTVKTDNLPIMNDGSGHSIAAKLTVVASTLQPANNEICITQFLQLSNRVGGDGNMYVRTYNQNNGAVTGAAWSPWQKQMGMVETLINSNDTTVGQEVFSGAAQKIGDGLNGMIDNGMYSGIYIDNLYHTGVSSLYHLSAQPTFVETFALVVINDYAASGQAGLPRHITQLKYAVDAITGQSTVKKRVGTGDNIISWDDWEDINNITIDNEVTTTSVNAVQSQAIAKAIEEGEKRAIRKLFLTAGAVYNNTNDIIKRIAPWDKNEFWKLEDDGTYTYWEEEAIVDNLPGYYYLNGLGDITEEQMLEIYDYGRISNSYKIDRYSYANIRTNFGSRNIHNSEELYNLAFMCANSFIEVFNITNAPNVYINRMISAFEYCNNLKYIIPIIWVHGDEEDFFTNTFIGCNNLILCRIVNLHHSISFKDSPNISKSSILFIIANSRPKSSITITLHQDAYIRIANQPDIIKVLRLKNEELLDSGYTVSLLSAETEFEN